MPVYRLPPLQLARALCRVSVTTCEEEEAYPDPDEEPEVRQSMACLRLPL